MQGFVKGRCACQKNHANKNHVRRGIAVVDFFWYTQVPFIKDAANPAF